MRRGNAARALARRAAVMGLAGLAGLSCSEQLETLAWKDATRPGLSVPPDTVAADSFVFADTIFGPVLLTGASSFLQIGRAEHQQPFAGTIDCRACFRWDLSGLPAGEVTEARIDLILRDLSGIAPGDPDSFTLALHEVTEAWTEDSLGAAAFPAIGPEIAAGVVPVTGVSDTSDVSLIGVFENAALAAVVEAWLADPDANHGLAAGFAASESQAGFLRFISSEGTPTGDAASINTPLLRVTVASGGSDTTVTLEPVDDAYQVVARDPVLSGPPVIPDSLLLLGAGHVQRLLIGLDREALQAVLPAGVTVHQATLRLTAMAGTDWSLAGEEELTAWSYRTSTEWSEAAVPESIVLDASLGYDAIDAEDGEAVLDIREAVQELIEQGGTSVVVLAGAETTHFVSALFKGRTAKAGRPVVTIVYSEPASGRLGGR